TTATRGSCWNPRTTCAGAGFRARTNGTRWRSPSPSRSCRRRRISTASSHTAIWGRSCDNWCGSKDANMRVRSKAGLAAAVLVDAHLVAGLCHGKLGNEAAMRRERETARGLIDSILQSGDGKSEASAFVVIQIAEEYSLLGVLGLRPSNQALIHAQGHSYDR